MHLNIYLFYFIVIDEKECFDRISLWLSQKTSITHIIDRYTPTVIGNITIYTLWEMVKIKHRRIKTTCSISRIGLIITCVALS